MTIHETRPATAPVTPNALEQRFSAEEGGVLLTGVQALARVPLDALRADRRAGLRTAAFISGYPGSPLGGLDLQISRNRRAFEGFDVVHQPGVNEELAVTAVMGSQIAERYGKLTHDGVIGFWYGKSPGVDRSGDALRHAQYFGVSPTGGAVAFVGDDPQCKSSSIPCASEATLSALNLPVLCPGSQQEALDLGLHAVTMSRLTGLWSALKIVTVVADGLGSVVVGTVHPKPALDDDGQPVQRKYGGGSRGLLTIMDDERDIHDVRLDLARRYATANELNVIESAPSDAWLGIMAPSHTCASILEALARLGIPAEDLPALGIRLLRVRALNMLEPAQMRHFARGLSTVMVVEEKREFLESQLRSLLYGMPDGPEIVGKRDNTGAILVSSGGALDVDALLAPLRRVLAPRLGDRVREPEVNRRTQLVLLPRVAAFCSGCPHNSSTKVPEDATVAGGIGCHSMTMWMDPKRVGSITTMTQMGGDGAQWIGAAPFVETDHLFQNVGDGGYAHSAQLAIQAAVAAGAHMTYKLLYNSAVAMTGGQDAPGARPVAKIAQILLSQGVSRIIVTTEDTSRHPRGSLPKGVDCWDRSRVIEAQNVLRATPGVTVMIHDQQCAAEARRRRKRGQQPEPATRVVIAERVCEGCGDCGKKSGCLSVEPVDTPLGRKTTIDQASCNKDYSCLVGDCPSFITAVPRRRPRNRLRKVARDHGAPPVAPEPPAWKAGEVDIRVRMPGVGGTGVVTVNQMVATAAKLDGLYVLGLDQIGLAQKGGAVISDLRLTSEQTDGQGAAPAASVDLFLAFDALAATSPMALAAASPERTVAVVSTSKTPTVAMVINPDVSYPEESALRAAIDANTQSDLNTYVDARRIARELAGSAAVANLVLLGVALQRGLLPVTPASLREAIELNGVAVKQNLTALEWGRAWVHDRAGVERALEESPLTAPEDPVQWFRDDLVSYQGQALADRFTSLVELAATAERRHAPDSTALTLAVAQGFHKLLTYKDEYEIGRLLLDPKVRAQVVRDSGLDDPKLTYNLHPPVLRQLGMKNKIRFGTWFDPALRALRASRRLRGTKLDPFGYALVRRTERALADEYEQAMRTILEHLTLAGLDHALKAAESPDLVRGYEHIKLDSVPQFREQLSDAVVAASNPVST